VSGLQGATFWDPSCAMHSYVYLSITLDAASSLLTGMP